MPNVLVSVAETIVSHPFCSAFIAFVAWTWASVFFKETDTQRLSVSYNDCVKNKQYWRAFSAILTHSSLLHLLLDVNCLWNLRFLETYYGSFFMFRYTVLLAITEALLAFGMMSLTVLCARRNPLVRTALHGLHAFGCSGIVLSWLVFQSIASAYEPIHPVFLFFGVSVSPSFAPLLMLTLFYFIAGRNNLFSTSAGLVNGYLMGSGLLLVLPNLYWSLCFLADVAIVLVVTAFHASPRTQQQQQQPLQGLAVANPLQSLSFRSYQGENSEEFIELQYDLDAVSPSASASATAAANTTLLGDAQRFRSRAEYDEEALEPLLEEDGTTTSSGSPASTLSRVTASIRRTLSRSGRAESSGQADSSTTGIALTDLVRRSSGYARVNADEV